MFALPYLAGTECIALLQRFGYRLRSRSGGFASLARESNVVIVPEASTLSPTLVRAILRTAKIDPHDFVRDTVAAGAGMGVGGPARPAQVA